MYCIEDKNLTDLRDNRFLLNIQNIYQLAAIATERNPEYIATFHKALEEFYSITDQIEYHLKTAKECFKIAESSKQHLPLPIDNIPNQPNTVTYTQFLQLVEKQISQAKEMKDMFVKSIPSNLTKD